MESKELAEYLDQQRWLMNSGLIPESLKNQLFFCGTIVHKDVRAVQLDLIPEKKLVEYKIFVPKKIVDKVNKYKMLSTKRSLFGLWRFKRFLKKEGDLNFEAILNRFIKDYCGPKWSVKAQVLDFEMYSDGEPSGNDGEGWVFNQQPDQQ